MANETRLDLDRYRSYLYLLARANIDPAIDHRIDASDLVQQTMVDAIQKQSQFRGNNHQQLAAWLKRILKNNLTDHFRQLQGAKRDIRREKNLESAVDKSFMRVDDWLAGQNTTPSAKAQTNEQLMKLPAALEKLPDTQHEAIVLFHLRGMTLSEVSLAMGKSKTAVGGLLYRGIKNLNEIMNR